MRTPLSRSKVAVIIPSYNRWKELKRLIDAFLSQSFLDFRLYIIASGYDKSTYEKIQNYHTKIELKEGDENWWWAKSINEGLIKARNSGEDLFLLMNDDTLIKNNFLKGVLSQHKQCQGILGMASIDSKTKDIFFSGISKVNWITAKFHRNHLSNSNCKVGSGIFPSLFLPGRGMLFGIEVLDKIGLINDLEFPQYYGDFEFTHRAYLRGISVNITMDYPIIAKTELTAKGTNTNGNLFDLLRSFNSPMSSNNIKKTISFYSKFSKLSIISVFFHVLRVLFSFIKNSSK